MCCIYSGYVRPAARTARILVTRFGPSPDGCPRESPPHGACCDARHTRAMRHDHRRRRPRRRSRRSRLRGVGSEQRHAALRAASVRRARRAPRGAHTTAHLAASSVQRADIAGSGARTASSVAPGVFSAGPGVCLLPPA
jgi:hypothetical protein